MATLLRMAAVVISAFVLIGFAAFASDQAAKGSATQVRAIDDTPAAESQREKKSGRAREFVNDANDVFLAPFEGVTSSRDPWVRHGVPTALALLLYGVGLMLLANYLPKPHRTQRDWRTA